GEAAAPCGNCDNCLEPPESVDGTVTAQKFLPAAYRCEKASGFPFGAQHLVDVLRGEASEKVRRFGHDQLAVFGAGAEMSAQEWRSVVRQLTIAGLVQVDSGRFNAICLTEAARPVLKGEQRVSLRKWREPPSGRRRRRGAAGAGAGPGGVTAAVEGLDRAAAARFDRLRAWRSTQAQAAGVPAYVIFHDATLREIARNEPRELEELAAIGGVGTRKLERYGAQLLAAAGGDAGDGTAPGAGLSADDALSGDAS